MMKFGRSAENELDVKIKPKSNRGRSDLIRLVMFNRLHYNTAHRKQSVPNTSQWFTQTARLQETILWTSDLLNEAALLQIVLPSITEVNDSTGQQPLEFFSLSIDPNRRF